jgi:hypothetical protein
LANSNQGEADMTELMSNVISFKENKITGDKELHSLEICNNFKHIVSNNSFK